MNAGVFQFAPGVRLRNEVSGQAILLVPEGIVDLSESAAAVLRLVDGRRSAHDIATELVQIYDASESELEKDVIDLCSGLCERGFLVV